MAIESSKIARNTTYLYLRMLITMGITFYTSRVVLYNLGITDYGIFSVVGGIAVLFTFLNNSLASSTQRYLTYAIGSGDKAQICKIFTVAIIVHIVIALVIVILSELFGVWIIMHKLDIPLNRMSDALVVFQCALAISAVSIINVPYTAAIIAEEKLNYFAVLGIVDTILKLAIAYLIVLFPNRLIAYAILLLVVSFMVFFATRVYCSMRLPGMKFHSDKWDLSTCKEIMSFTGWHMARNGAMIGVSQGNNILVNMFGGPVASAAMGILTQVTSGVGRFMTSVQTAFSPQITKNYSVADVASSVKLVITSAKLSALLFLLIGIPLIVNMDFILSIWLKNVPENTAMFCKFGLVCLLMESLSVPIDTLIMAVGKIKRYELVSSIIWLTSLLLAYISLKGGFSFRYVLVFRIAAGLVYDLYEAIYLKKFIEFSVKYYLVNVLVKPLVIGTVCLGITFLAVWPVELDYVKLLWALVSSTIVLCVLAWYVVFDNNEKMLIRNMLKKIPFLAKLFD